MLCSSPAATFQLPSGARGEWSVVLRELMHMRASSDGAERAIADYLIAHRSQLGVLSARGIAAEVHVAPSTVVRFCQRLGFDGYASFRAAVQAELSYLISHFDEIDPNYPFDFGDQRLVIAPKIGSLYCEIVDDTLGLIDDDSIDRAVGILGDAAEILVCSTGVELEFAQGFKNKMLKIGCVVTIEPRVSSAFFWASHAGSGDVCFVLLSYSGESERLLRVARRARESRAPVVAITSFGGNSLSEIAGVALYVSSRERLERNIRHFAMNISTALLLDIVYACIFNQDHFVNYQSRVETALAYEASKGAASPARPVGNGPLLPIED